MQRPSVRECTFFVLLVAMGVIARVVFQHVPNFAPVAGLALFAGYYFRGTLLAIATPVMVMLISDRLVDAGGYELPLMLTVYGLLTLPVFLRTVIRRYFFQPRSSLLHIGLSVGGVLGCGLVCSLVFFVGTNFMVWATSSWYEPTLSGLAHCMTAAIPFFRYTLVGDAAFTLLFFGCHALATSVLTGVGKEDSKLLAAS